MSFFSKNGEALRFSKYVLFHPFGGFYELKYESKGSMPAALFFLFIYFLSVVWKESSTGYLYSGTSGAQFSLFICLLKALAPLILFCTANWCLTLLLNGEGKMGQIFISLCYAVIPMIFRNLIFTALSNIFSLNESLYLTLISGFCLLWTAFLILCAVMETNQYTFAMSCLSCLLSVIGIAILLLIILLCGDVISQVFRFIYSVIREVTYSR